MNPDDVGKVGVDLCGVLFRPDDDRHTVMDRGHQGIGLDGEDGEGDDVPCRIMPGLQQTPIGSALRKPDQVRLSPVACRPLIKCIRRNQHTALAVGVAEHRFDRCCFRLGVDRLLQLVGVFDPGGEQALVSESEYPIVGGDDTHHQNRLGRRDIEMRLQVRIIGGGEMLLEPGG